MKRFSKVLALCLLLAVALSVFGVFSAFAEDTTAAPVVTYDMNKKLGKADTIPSKAKDIKGSDGSVIGKSVSVEYNTLDDGTPYYSHIVRGEDKGDGTYSTLESSSNAYLQISPATTNIKTTTKYGEKNTDFMVIDFDLSTNDNLFDGFYFHTRWRNDAGNSQKHYPHFGADEIDETFYVASKDKIADKATFASDAKSGWVNVTMVYDFRGTDGSAWKCHVYLDGIFSGTVTPCDAGAANLYFIRISYNTLQPNQISSANFANFTVTRFPVGYSGDLGTNVANLAKVGATLSDFDDLAYCLENTPTQLITTPVASVVRGEETFDVLNTTDLSAILQDGDVVTLNRNTTVPVVVPKGADITWNLGNCKEPALIEVDYDTAAAVITDLITGAHISSPAEADIPSAISAKKAADIKVTLLKDITYTSSTSISNSKTVYFNLNGHKITFNTTNHVFTPASASKLRFANGSIDFKSTSSSNLAMMNYSAFFSVENMTEVTTDANAAVMVDQRSGYVRILNCERIESGKALISPKSSAKVPTKVSIENSVYTALNSSAFDVSNVNQSKVGRYGSLNTTIVIENSTVNAPKGTLVNAEVYANASGTIDSNKVYTETTNAACLANENKLALVVKDSTVNSLHSVVSGSLVSVVNSNNKVPANGMTFDVALDINNSDVTASYLLKQYGGSESVDYHYGADIRVDTGFLNLTGDTLVQKDIASEKATVDVTMCGEVQLTTGKVVADGVLGSSFNTVSPYALINRTVTETNSYRYAVTTKCAPYPIIVNGEESELQWYADDVITLEDLPDDLLPPANKYVSYEWIYNDDGAFEAVRTGNIPVNASITLKNDIAFNIYLPADLDAATYASVTVNGNAVQPVDVTVDGEAYKLVKITDINPAKADEKVKVQFVAYIGGVRIERITQRISVLDYAKTALADDSVENKALIASVVNYIAAAQDYVGDVSAAVAEVVASDDYKNALPENVDAAAVNTVSALGVLDRVYLTLDSAFTYKFVTKADFKGTITVNGTDYEIDGMEVISVSVEAADILDSVTISVNGVDGEYNVAAYLDAFSASGADAAALADAIALYAQEANKAQ